MIQKIIKSPQILYKYRPINKNTESMLVKRELYFPTIREINDPFDCRVYLDRNGSKKQIWNWFIKTLEKKYGQSTPQELIKKVLTEYCGNKKSIDEEIVESYIRNKKWKVKVWNLQAGLDNVNQNRLKSTRIFCVSSKCNDILMWSHYACGHTGICLGFKKDENTIPFKHVKKVQYNKRYPRKNYYKTKDRDYYKYAFLTKSVHWKYEDEWRIILPNAGDIKIPYYHFQPDILEKVIFGCQCNDTEKNNVLTWLKKGGLEPSIYCAKMSEKEYALDFVKIS